ncbi:MAG: phosphonate ABC transporter, permease protein PhnE [Tyzzerella sp.]|uniref:Phosphonate ABC transporter, permease protein PhnE n=1 Tax=Candidatus Fimicola merdigallinarum TaxID=2840819 RepID=A0A9D9H0H6_9FIRM|nr:phosphonate ABC transporter, permease protein PhnE [Candidatus Fimicola merdigallinarum]
MIKEKSNIKTILAVVVALAIVIYSAIGIDYSGLSTFSTAMAKDVFVGLLKPDWSFVYDGSGEDLLSLLLLTIEIAFLGTCIGVILAFPVSLLSARKLWNSLPIVSKIGKIFCDILRAVPELVYAIIFVKVVGPGPFAGALAIGVHQIGMLGKLFAEEMENTDDKVAESMNSVGAGFWQTLFYARFPQVMPLYSSLALNYFEIAVRSAVTLGLVGAGGIGAPLVFAIQARNWSTVSIILLGVIITVFLIDIMAGIIRKRLR